jgi:hypothetical protein
MILQSHILPGTIKKAQGAAIEHNRLVVARFRARAYSHEKSPHGKLLTAIMDLN